MCRGSCREFVEQQGLRPDRPEAAGGLL
jgi:hypothetical protein